MYRMTKLGVIQRLADNASIPADDGNHDYRAYLAWCDAGNAPAEPDPAELLADAKAARLAALEARYEASLAAGMAYGGKVLQIRESDQQNIAAMGQEARWVVAAGGDWPGGFAWRMADNSFLALPAAADMVALGEAAKAEIYRLRQVKWAHADLIAAAESVAAALTHDIDTGW